MRVNSGIVMKKKKHPLAQIVSKLRKVETLTAQGSTVAEAVKQIGVDGTPLVDAPVRAAASLLSAILNQDIKEGEDGEPESSAASSPTASSRA